MPVLKRARQGCHRLQHVHASSLSFPSLQDDGRKKQSNHVQLYINRYNAHFSQPFPNSHAATFSTTAASSAACGLDDEKIDTTTKKDEIMNAFRNDLPEIMDEIFVIVQEEQEEEQKKRDLQEMEQRKESKETTTTDDKEDGNAPLVLENREDKSLRTRFEKAWQQHCIEKHRMKMREQAKASHWLSMDNLEGWGVEDATKTPINNMSMEQDFGSGNKEEHDDMEIKMVPFSDIHATISAHFETARDGDHLETENHSFDLETKHDVVGTDSIADEKKSTSESKDLTESAIAAGILETQDVFGADKKDKVCDSQLGAYLTVDNQKEATDTVVSFIPCSTQEEVERVCLFLEKISARDWHRFDKDIDEDEVETGMEEQAGHDIAESAESYSDQSDVTQNMRLADQETELTDLDLIHDLLDEALQHNTPLSTVEYNLLLARIATSPEMTHEEIMDNLLNAYHHLSKFNTPDESTYKILFLTLDRRISSGSGSSDGTIVTLLNDMMHFQVKLSSDTLLRLGMRSLERGNNLKLAKKFVMDFALDDEGRSFRVPSQVFRSLMKMIARENEQELAILLLKKCIKVSYKHFCFAGHRWHY